jgi:hypothetical protein
MQSQPATALAPPAGAPSVAESGVMQQMQSLADLIEAAARKLGMNDADTAEAGRSGVLAVNGKKVALVPMIAPNLRAEATLRVLLSVDTGVAQRSLAATQLLAHAQGVLAPFSTALGLSAQGHWLLHRMLWVLPHDAQALADAIVSDTRRAESMLNDVSTLTAA